MPPLYFTPKVGDSVWFVPGDSRITKAQALTVTKVGRQYIHAEEPGRHWTVRRFRIENLREASSYGSGGRLYRSEDDHTLAVRRDIAWARLRGAIDRRYGCPDGVTTEAIEQAAALLGVKL